MSSTGKTELPVASEVGEVHQEEKTVADLPALLEMFKAVESQLSELKKATRQAMKSKVVVKAERKKREGSFPKGETPSQVKAWNEAVQAALEQMKSVGWPEYQTKAGVTVAGSELREGVHCFPNGKQPTYKDAMSYASVLKAASAPSSVASSGAVTPSANPAKVAKALEKEAKAAEKEASKLAKLAEKEAAKAAKEAEKAAKQAEKEAAKATKQAEKEAAKAAKQGAKEAKPVVEQVVAPSSVSNEEEEGMDAQEWSFRGKTYFRTAANECWMKNEDGSMGKWAGVYDPVSDKIDDSVAEPEIEFD